jgi:hypothetical protein
MSDTWQIHPQKNHQRYFHVKQKRRVQCQIFEIGLHLPIMIILSIQAVIMRIISYGTIKPLYHFIFLLSQFYRHNWLKDK